MLLDNTVKGKKERIGRMLQVTANSRSDIDEAFADIVALAGLKDKDPRATRCATRQCPSSSSAWNSAACDRDRHRAEDEPRPREDAKRWSPSCDGRSSSAAKKSDEEIRPDDHLGTANCIEVLVDRVRREFKVERPVGTPQVAYRETITRVKEKDYTHKKQTGGTGQLLRQDRLRAEF